MGSFTLETLENIGDNEKTRERVEGGPLSVVDDSASALMYACLYRGNPYDTLAM